MQPVGFKERDTGERDVGLMAEDVEKVIQDLFIYDNQGKPDAIMYNVFSYISWRW